MTDLSDTVYRGAASAIRQHIIANDDDAPIIISLDIDTGEEDFSCAVFAVWPDGWYGKYRVRSYNEWEERKPIVMEFLEDTLKDITDAHIHSGHYCVRLDCLEVY